MKSYWNFIDELDTTDPENHHFLPQAHCLEHFFFFNVDNFFKVYIEFLHYCFCFKFCFFGLKACGILVPQRVIKLATPRLEGKVLTTGPPGKSLLGGLLIHYLI